MAGSSSITGQQSILFADNMSFDGTARGGAMTTNAQLWIGSTASPHVRVGTITSPDGSVTIGYAAPNITITSNGGLTITGNSGGPIPPAAGNWNIVGSLAYNMNTIGAGNTLTIRMAGTTDHAVQVGNTIGAVTSLPLGTSGQILQSSGAGVDPAWTTSTYPSTNSSGNLIYGSASNVYSNLAVDTSVMAQGLPLGIANGLPVWRNPMTYYYLFEDFEFPAQFGFRGYGTATANSGTLSQFTGLSTNPGIVALGTATSTNAQAVVRQGENNNTNWPYILGGGIWDFNFLVRLSNLSDGTDTYTARFGIHNANGFGAPGQGIYFTYTSTGATPNWNINNTNGGGTSTTDSGIAASTNWDHFRITVDAGATAVRYFINGVETAGSPKSNNVPTAAIGFATTMIKSAGTGVRTLQFDYWSAFNLLTTPRG